MRIHWIEFNPIEEKYIHLAAISAIRSDSPNTEKMQSRSGKLNKLARNPNSCLLMFI
jgi:hypothetical protein